MINVIIISKLRWQIKWYFLQSLDSVNWLSLHSKPKINSFICSKQKSKICFTFYSSFFSLKPFFGFYYFQKMFFFFFLTGGQFSPKFFAALKKKETTRRANVNQKWLVGNLDVREQFMTVTILWLKKLRKKKRNRNS